MSAGFMMVHVNDVKSFTHKEDALRDCLAWVRHWKTDVECGLKPTQSSLDMVEAKIVKALEERG